MFLNVQPFQGYLKYSLTKGRLALPIKQAFDLLFPRWSTVGACWLLGLKKSTVDGWFYPDCVRFKKPPPKHLIRTAVECRVRAESLLAVAKILEQQAASVEQDKRSLRQRTPTGQYVSHNAPIGLPKPTEDSGLNPAEW